MSEKTEARRNNRVWAAILAGFMLLSPLVLLVYALLKASPTTLRWWAGLATVAVPVVGFLGWWLGAREARARVAGIEQGIEHVAKAAAETVAVAQKTADVRVNTARRARRRDHPTIQQVFLPGLPAGGGWPAIEPARGEDGEVEL